MKANTEGTHPKQNIPLGKTQREDCGWLLPRWSPFFPFSHKFRWILGSHSCFGVGLFPGCSSYLSPQLSVSNQRTEKVVGRKDMSYSDLRRARSRLLEREEEDSTSEVIYITWTRLKLYARSLHKSSVTVHTAVCFYISTYLGHQSPCRWYQNTEHLHATPRPPASVQSSDLHNDHYPQSSPFWNHNKEITVLETTFVLGERRQRCQSGAWP